MNAGETTTYTLIISKKKVCINFKDIAILRRSSDKYMRLWEYLNETASINPYLRDNINDIIYEHIGQYPYFRKECLNGFKIGVCMLNKNLVSKIMSSIE